MQGRVLAYQIIVADEQTARLITEFNVLRFAAQDRVLVNAIAASQRGEPFNDGVSRNLASFADDNIIFDDNVGANARIHSNQGARTDDGCRMNVHDWLVRLG
jgi:hypothetical protein